MRGIVAAACVFMLASCGGGARGGTAGQPDEAQSPAERACVATGESTQPGTVAVFLTDFEVQPSACEASAGSMTFDVAVDPQVEGHAFDVLKTDLAADALPTTGSGMADYLAEGIEVVGSLPTMGGGEGDTLSVDLESGHYVLICNIVDHYSRGMSMPFTVA
jgi:uncharacterized cupredoxin-like copper-binding protein